MTIAEQSGCATEDAIMEPIAEQSDRARTFRGANQQEPSMAPMRFKDVVVCIFFGFFMAIILTKWVNNVLFICYRGC
ncbi:hypothetical protein Tsubulata_046475 [Turnera subulata]|uniref:Uncharacterized protein n=1 Tax=Turnera subulata TaxID=218843 RepID=A0A9Q0JL94_9ROSI|nr:hypothetical protein Tsubulata_046475 [Turnera subulata]